MKALVILLVEDDAMIGESLAEPLESLGHTVCAVERNATDAVAAASHRSLDLMIVDVGLGEASGIAAVKEILRVRLCRTCLSQEMRCEACRSALKLSSFKSLSGCRTWAAGDQTGAPDAAGSPTSRHCT